MRTLIIGGGLSGLALADAMEAQGRDYLLLDARDRFGGRILSERFEDAHFDMGPAWFWQGQPRVAALAARFGLQVFEQFSTGLQAMEDAQGQVQHIRGFAAMQGSLRIEGGLAALTQALADGLPEERKRLNAKVDALEVDGQKISATLMNGEVYVADKVVLALPPRVAAMLRFAPALPADLVQTMQHIPTWMAGQAKALAIYQTPFWREAGLSGDGSSRFGPMVEIHDASPAQGGPYALFGFIGVPPQHRKEEKALKHHIKAQLVRLFGEEAAEPAQLLVKDWAFDPNTATPADQAPLYAHPQYNGLAVTEGVWKDRVHFAGTEVAPEFGGFLEGALEAAEDVLPKLAQGRDCL